MGAVRGFVTGGFGLITLYLVVSSPQTGLDTAAGMPGKVAHWLIDPDVPLIPDRRAPAAPRPPGASDPNQLPGDIFPKGGDPNTGQYQIRPDGSVGGVSA